MTAREELVPTHLKGAQDPPGSGVGQEALPMRSAAKRVRTVRLTSEQTRQGERQRMSRPVLFVIDDDAGVVHALRDDLRRRFGEDFRVIGESSAAAGLATLRDWPTSTNPWRCSSSTTT